MKKLITSLAMLTIVSAARGDITVLFPDGDFDSPAGTRGAWEEVGGGTTWNYPTTGGNPNGYGVMNGAGGWGIWVGGNSTPLPIAPMGLVAGGTYTFVQDMKTITSGGGQFAGIKIESWGAGGKISDSGDMRADTESTSWETYSFVYTLAEGTTGLKIVPLWSPDGTVGYDNIGVIVPPQPLVASILSPVELATVSSITFTINATATVSPGTVTNVAFYDGTTLLGNDTVYPYSFNYDGATVGSHTLTVVARDDQGGITTSSPITVDVAFVAPPPLTYPTNNAPLPIWPVASVNSMYNSSGTYTDRTPINWFPWGVTSSRGDYLITGGSVVKSYLGLNYAGVEINPTYAPASSYNASGMTTLHLDVWTTANQLAVQLQSVNGIGGNVGAIVNYPADGGVVTSNHWVSLDLPLSWFTTTNALLDLTHLDQLLWLDNAGYPGDPGVLLGDFYIDNVYFYNNTPIIQSPAVSGTNFTLKVASQVGINYVVQGSPALVPATWTGLKTNAGTGGLLEFSIPITPGNPQRFFRIDAQ